MSQNTLDTTAGSVAVPEGGFVTRLLGAVAWVRDLLAARATRRQLSSLDDHLLADIGLQRMDVEAMKWGSRGFRSTGAARMVSPITGTVSTATVVPFPDVVTAATDETTRKAA